VDIDSRPGGNGLEPRPWTGNPVVLSGVDSVERDFFGFRGFFAGGPENPGET